MILSEYECNGGLYVDNINTSEPSFLINSATVGDLIENEVDLVVDVIDLVDFGVFLIKYEVICHARLWR